VAPKARPRDFAPLDREFLEQDTVQELGERFAPAGPLVLLALILEAGKVTAAANPGHVDLRFAPIARKTYVTPGKVREIVETFGQLGLMEGYSTDGVRFQGRLTKFPRWESVAKTDAQRKAESRARDSERQASTPSPDDARP
jgi:hypothetical protein